MIKIITHEFVEFVPADLVEGVVYVSIPYSTIVHKCLCGCGMKVVTPIRPDKWTLTYNGEAISLDPSIGNWSFPCRSHYFIRKGRVLEAGPMSQSEVRRGRAHDAELTAAFHGKVAPAPPIEQPAPPRIESKAKKKRGFWTALVDIFRG
jgi:hypothetical protein